MAALVFKNIKEAREKMKERREQLGKILEEAGTDLDFSAVKTLTQETDEEKLVEFRRLNDELDAWGKEMDEHWRPIEEAARGLVEKEREIERRGFDTKGGDAPMQPYTTKMDKEPRGLMDHLWDSKDFKEFREASGSGQKSAEQWGRSPGAAIDEFPYHAQKEAGAKALMDRATGWTPEITRVPGMVIYDPQQQPTFVDILPRYQTGQTTVRYMREDPFVSMAGFIPEGAAAPEQQLGLSEENQTVEQLAVYLPVTELQLEDEAMARSYIDRRLVFAVRQKLSLNCLNGTGANNQLEGLLNTSGINALDASALIDGQQQGVNNFDAVMRGITKAEVTGFRMCTNVVMHPQTWQQILLQKDANGNYMYGWPGMGVREKMLWGLPVMCTTEMAAGQCLVGDFEMSVGLFERRGLTVRISDNVNDDFIRFKLAVRVDLRAALVTMLPQAFTKISNMKNLVD